MNIFTHFLGGILSIVSVRALAQQGKDDWHYIIFGALLCGGINMMIVAVVKRAGKP